MKKGAHLKRNPLCCGVDFMAKRYFSHEFLSSINGSHKPSGTMGNHYLEVSCLEDGSLLVEGFNPPNLSKKERQDIEISSDRYSSYLAFLKTGGEWLGEIPSKPKKMATESISKVILRPEWTLGYDCGELWVIMPAHLVKDPIHRILRECKLPKDFVEWVDDYQDLNLDGLEILQREGCVAFYNGEVIHSQTNFGCLVKKYRKVGPIDQRVNWSRGIFLKGTDRQIVAEFLREGLQGGIGATNKIAMLFTATKFTKIG